MRFFISLLFLLCPLTAFSSYTAKSLKLKDYEEMRTVLKGYIKKSREKAPQESASDGLEEAVLELKKGLKVLFMRPDTDNINFSLVLMIQNEIINHRAFMPVFAEMVKDSVQEFKSKKGSVSHQASLLYLIENAISYLQSINTEQSTKILQSIKTANLKISKKLSNYLILEMDRGKTANPSSLAKRVLAKRFKENRQAEKLKKAKEQKVKQFKTKAQAKIQETKAVEEKRKLSSEKSPKSEQSTVVEVEL